jgi:hypothetical protein
VTHLGGGAEGDDDEVDVVASRASRTALDDVGGHRDRRSTYLRLQPVSPLDGNLPRLAVDVDDELLGQRGGG